MNIRRTARAPTRSWQVLYSGEVGRNLLGVVKAVGEGTVEKKAIPLWTSGTTAWTMPISR